MASDLVSSWRSEGVPSAVRAAAGLRASAETLVKRASAGPEHVGWTMVTIVSEFWRDRLASTPPGRRLLLLPDCPVAGHGPDDQGSDPMAAVVPRVCGPSCGIATIWSAARDSGWVVEPVGRAVAGIGSLLTGQYDSVLGMARLGDLEKAFAMLPAFSLPVAAVPYEPLSAPLHAGCAESLASSAIDVEWVLGLVGVAGGGTAPVGDYLPLLREAAEMFSAEQLSSVLAERLGLGQAVWSGLRWSCRVSTRPVSKGHRPAASCRSMRPPSWQPIFSREEASFSGRSSAWRRTMPCGPIWGVSKTRRFASRPRRPLWPSRSFTSHRLSMTTSRTGI
jgi:hypothetical protein